MHTRVATRQVLLIENDSAVKDRVLAELAERDCHVRTVALGQDGVSLALELRPDLLVLNLALPDMTGAEVVRRVRALDGLALVPAVFVSSERYDAAHPEASAGVVLKPFLMSDLASALDFAFVPTGGIRDDGAGERGPTPRDSPPEG
jgi:DNA-binding response OmpR family regulator